jgi:hypothetical protein
LATKQIVSPDINLDTLGREIMNSQSVSNILRKFQKYPLYFLLVFEVGSAGDTMTDGFHGTYELFVHDTGLISTIRICPQFQTIDPEPTLQYIRGNSSQLAYGVDTIVNIPP